VRNSVLYVSVTAAALAFAQGARADEASGNWSKERKALAARGITYELTYTSEWLANVSGGLRTGSVYQGKLEGAISADLEKLMGWSGWKFYANAFQIHGTGGIGGEYVGSLNTVSNIEARPTTRLSEIWLERAFANDKASFRFGQLTADSEFLISDYGSFFLSNDWPTITKQNLPGGGPAYPLSTPGVRLKYEPTKDTAFLVALFNGDPSTPGAEDPEVANRYGLNFRVNDTPLLMAEMQFRDNWDDKARGLARAVRIGGWYHFGKFEDQRFGTDGLSLANPFSNGIPRPFTANQGVYGIIDQQLYRPEGGDHESGITSYARISAAPSDRNLIEFYLDGGIIASGGMWGRPDDKFGASFIYSRISNRVRGYEQDLNAYTGLMQAQRNYELSLELTYVAQIRNNWTLQPDFQYIINPSGQAAAPDGSVRTPLKNAMVVGVRSIIKF